MSLRSAPGCHRAAGAPCRCYNGGMATRKLIIGCGYLGRRVAQCWLTQGDTVFALTRSANNARVLCDSGIEPVIGDVTDAASLVRLPEIDTILYAVGLDRSSGKSQHEVYVGGLENVLDRVLGKVRRFLYVSSTSVYGQNGGEWVDETSDCRPEAENGKVCRNAELLLHSRFSAANILRLAGIYGPERLVARLAALRAGMTLEGNLDAWLNLIHVDDAVTAILACECRGGSGTTYLVCDDNPCRRREFYSLLANLIGAPPPQTMPAAGIAVDSAALNKRCSNRRVREELKVVLRYPSIEIGLPAALTPSAPNAPRRNPLDSPPLQSGE